MAVLVDRKDNKLKNMIALISDGILERSKMKIMPLVLTEKEAGENWQFAEELRKGEVVYERAKRSRVLAGKRKKIVKLRI